MRLRSHRALAYARALHVWLFLVDLGSGGNCDVVYGQCCSGRTVILRDGAIEVGLSLQLAAPGRDKLGLTLKNKVKRRRARAKLSLFALIEFFGGIAGSDGRRKSRLG